MVVMVFVMGVMTLIEIDGQSHRGAAGAIVIQHGHHDLEVMPQMAMIQVADDIGAAGADTEIDKSGGAVTPID
jgi:hypothetical protein